MNTPARFGRYRLIKRIGSGGMAEIHLARLRGAEGLEKLLVLKRIRQEYARRPQFVSMFIEEARIAVSLNHPNIVQVYEFGHVHGEYYIAMEYVEGTDLALLLSRSAQNALRIHWSDAVYITIEIAKALDYANRKKDRSGNPLHIVHRDISPQNILISRDGGVKLLDFGIARASAHSTNVQSRALEGKISYMSPEQARSEPVDHRSDLFSLGLVLYELLTGSPAFPFSSQHETLTLVQNAILPPTPPILQSLPAPLQETLYTLLQPLPDNRYNSARDLHHALHQILIHTSILPDSVSLAHFVSSLNMETRILPSGSFSAVPDSPILNTQHLTPNEHTLHEHTTNDLTPTATLVAQPNTPPPRDTSPPHPPLSTSNTSSWTRSSANLHPGQRYTERVRAVFLCGNMQGFSALRDNTPGDTWRQTLFDCIRIVESLSFKNHAIVERISDDGFTLLLGLPVSSENDAERAMILATDLIEAFDGINLSLSSPLSLSIGVSSGPVLVTHTPNSPQSPSSPLDWTHEDETSSHNNLHIAQHLAHTALAREILLTHRVSSLVQRSFHTQELPPLNPQTPHAHRLLGPLSSQDHIHTIANSYTRFFGRDIALRALRDTHREVLLDSSTRVFWIQGEQGIGKSTLAQEFLSGLRSSSRTTPYQIFRCVLDLSHHDRVYGALMHVIHQVLQTHPNSEQRTIATRINALTNTLLQNLPHTQQQPILHSLAFLLGIHTNSNPISSLDPPNRRATIASSLRTILHLLASIQPIVFVVDDMHNADNASLRFFADLLTSSQDSPVLFLITSLPHTRLDNDNEWNRLLTAPNIHIERLHELDPSTARDLVSSLLPPPLRSHPPLLDAILERSGGHPLYIKELLHTLLSFPDQDPHTLTAALQRNHDAPLPDTVEELTTNRIHRLPLHARQTLQRCAILGSSFNTHDATTLLSIPENTLHADLHLLREQRLITPLHPADETPKRWTFSNAVVQNVAATSLPEPERISLHTRIAEFLQHSPTPINHSALARHLEAAGRTSEAGIAYLTAAQHALDAVGCDPCIRLATRALNTLPPTSPKRIAALELQEHALALLGQPQRQEKILKTILQDPHTPEPSLLHAQLRLASIALERGEVNEAEDIILDVLEHPSTQHTHLHTQALRLHASLHHQRGQHTHALNLLNQAIHNAQSLPTPPQHHELWACWVDHAHIQQQLSHPSQALQSYQRALDSVQGVGYRSQELSTLIGLGGLHADLGQLDEAHEFYQRALSLAQSLGYTYDEAHTLSSLGKLLFFSGDTARAHQTLLRAARVARKARHRHALTLSLIYLGFVFLDHEHPLQAQATLKKALRLADSIHNPHLLCGAHIVSSICQTYLDPPNWSSALSFAQHAQRLATQSSTRHNLAHAHSLIALSLFHLQQPDDALQHSHTALSLIDPNSPHRDDALIHARHTHICLQLHPEQARTHSKRARDLLQQRLHTLDNPTTKRSFLRSLFTRRVLTFISPTTPPPLDDTHNPPSSPNL